MLLSHPLQEAREWLAALDAARLELAKAQSGNETGLAHEARDEWKDQSLAFLCAFLQVSCRKKTRNTPQAVEEAAEYLQEVEVARQDVRHCKTKTTRS